jgi:putative membrane protein
LGFGAGLVPGLHMNNIAAAITAYTGATAAVFGLLGGIVGSAGTPLLISCFISAALVGHLFAESITSTYLGIPAEDAVSVLPAHRLARAGLGETAVRSSADGSLCGVLVAAALLLPMCLFMGHPIEFYRLLARVMGFIMIFFTGVLLCTEGLGRPGAKMGVSILKAALMFSAAGILGVTVLCTDFCACSIPDFPITDRGFVLRSSLLLPLFAGLYGVPSLILGLRSETVLDFADCPDDSYAHSPGKRDIMMCILGGALVGWMPGMTAGSSATICAPSVRECPEDTDVHGSVRFIWLYSSISASGAVFAVGALFMILRARSGCMDAVQFFLGDLVEPGSIARNLEPMLLILVSMLIAAWLGHMLISNFNPKLHRVRKTICSRRVAIASLVFVGSLSLLLTGTRGALVMATAVCLGLLPPLTGVRRIQLMGCLLVPITMNFFGLA